MRGLALTLLALSTACASSNPSVELPYVPEGQEAFPYVSEHISPEAQAYQREAVALAAPELTSFEDWQRYRDYWGAELNAIAQDRQKTLGYRLREDELGGVPVLWVTPRSVDPDHAGRLLIYIHGGGYTVTNALQNAWMAAEVATQLSIRALAIDFRNAPEFPYPSALDDTLAVYRALLADHSAEKLFVMGDSAGGGLSLATVLRIRDEGLPLPAAVALLSPWADIQKSGDSYYVHEGVDAYVSYDVNHRQDAGVYVGEHDPRHPYISPVYADYTLGFPPSLFICGTRDLFLSNCARMQEALLLAGQPVELIVLEGMDHGLGMFPRLPDGDKTFRFAAEFFARQIASAAKAPD